MEFSSKLIQNAVNEISQTWSHSLGELVRRFDERMRLLQTSDRKSTVVYQPPPKGLAATSVERLAEDPAVDALRRVRSETGSTNCKT